MNRKTCFAIFTLAAVINVNSLQAADVVTGGEPEALPVSPPKTNEAGLPIMEAPKEGGANAGGAMGVETGIAPVAGKGAGDSVVPLATCTTWWVHGNHNWKYRYAFLYVKNEMSAQTDTYYGTWTDPDACGRPPLTADVLVIDGRTYGGWPNVEVKKTGYNTSIITKSSSATAFGGGLSPICGATATHKATKSGISWSTYTRSGCA